MPKLQSIKLTAYMAAVVGYRLPFFLNIFVIYIQNWLKFRWAIQANVRLQMNWPLPKPIIW